MTTWIAYCAPGRTLITELNCLFIDETVTEVRESQALDGSDKIILVNEEELLPPPLPPFGDWAAELSAFLPGAAYRNVRIITNPPGDDPYKITGI